MFRLHMTKCDNLMMMIMSCVITFALEHAIHHILKHHYEA